MRGYGDRDSGKFQAGQIPNRSNSKQAKGKGAAKLHPSLLPESCHGTLERFIAHNSRKLFGREAGSPYERSVYFRLRHNFIHIVGLD